MRNHAKHYWLLAAMAALSFMSMYVLMYSMADRFANVYPSINQLYMAGLMTAPMILIELLLMRGMYQNRKLNATAGLIALAALFSFFVLIRRQTAVDDQQFLKSMIPHHASAILMCREAAIEDPDIRDLCGRIVSGQQAEIDEMKAKLAELE
ncbi:MAG: DUF305 domain-containing protein [Gemmatimonadales bacterium]|jgi:hypothetical protein